ILLKISDVYSFISINTSCIRIKKSLFTCENGSVPNSSAFNLS
uniref:Uncharacterized protein n=1 Tax=Amphimedon queenslandica TaxID=400682 RepID=A0A1X7U546_AMPQE